jgi:hypothetical protein
MHVDPTMAGGRFRTNARSAGPRRAGASLDARRRGLARAVIAVRSGRLFRRRRGCWARHLTSCYARSLGATVLDPRGLVRGTSEAEAIRSARRNAQLVRLGQRPFRATLHRGTCASNDARATYYEHPSRATARPPRSSRAASEHPAPGPAASTVSSVRDGIGHWSLWRMTAADYARLARTPRERAWPLKSASGS